MKPDEPDKELPAGGAKSAMDRLEKHADARMRYGSSPDGVEGGASSVRRFAGMGFEFLAVILVFGLIGQWVDKKFQWHGVATVVAVTIAAIGDLYLQIKILLKTNHKDTKLSRPDQDGDE
ncbi:MAG: AtpZ/AtpI family protein [Phycisphaerae bacterium]|nr:AtpZ/AtpI family protein [Phycisphaerae bacterium]